MIMGRTRQSVERELVQQKINLNRIEEKIATYTELEAPIHLLNQREQTKDRIAELQELLRSGQLPEESADVAEPRQPDGDTISQQVHIGGRHIGDIYQFGRVEGDVIVFKGDYASLSTKIRLDADLLAHGHPDNFVGRVFLDAALDTFLNTHDRGYFLLIGEPGIGKTVWAAHLVHTRGYLYHFISAPKGRTDARTALENLCAQLTTRFGLDHQWLPPNAGDNGDFLAQLLQEAAERQGSDHKLTLVIDALDEADRPAHPAANLFDLPENLPVGVYFILTTRPVDIPLYVGRGVAKQEMRLDSDSPENQADVRHYLEVAARRPSIASRLAEQGIAESDFVAALAERSAGSFMYLVCALDDIAEGEMDPLVLDQLPHGLAEYYAWFWRRLQAATDEETWLDWHEPLLGLLAAAQEPVAAEQLAAWLGRDDPKRVRRIERLLTRAWCRFLTPTTHNNQTLWRLYHQSFQDYLCAQLDGARRVHAAIVDHYRARCNDHWPDLVADDYPRRHLAAHLAAAGQTDELHALISEPWCEARYAHEGNYAGFLADIHQAWDIAEKEGPQAVGKQIRYGLIKSSIVTHLTRDLPVDWLIAFVQRGVWMPIKVQTYAESIPDPKQRAETMAALAASVAEQGLLQESHRIATDAWRTIQNIEKQEDQALALYTLAPCLPDSFVADALDMARSCDKPETKAELLISLIPRLDEKGRKHIVREIIETAGEIELLDHWVTLSPQRRIIRRPQSLARSVAQLVFHLPKEEGSIERWNTYVRRSIVTKAPISVQLLFQLAMSVASDEERLSILTATTHLAQDIEDPAVRAAILARLSLYLPEDVWAEILNQATIAAGEVAEVHERAQVLAELVPCARAVGWTDVIEKVWQTAISVNDPYIRATVLCQLARNLEEAQQSSVIHNEVRDAIRQLEPGEDYYRAEVLIELVSLLPSQEERQATVDEARGYIQSFQRANDRAELLGRLTSIAPLETREQLFQEAVDAATSIMEKPKRAEALVGLARLLPDAERAQFFREHWYTLQALETDTVGEERGSGFAAHSMTPLLSYRREAMAMRAEISSQHSVKWLEQLAATYWEIGPGYRRILALGQPKLTVWWLRTNVWLGLLADLFPYLATETKTEVFAKAQESCAELQDSHTPQDSHMRAVVQVLLAPLTPQNDRGAALNKAREIASAIEAHDVRANALSFLAEYLEGDARDIALSEALDAAKRIENNDWGLGATLMWLIPQLPSQLLRQASDIARNIRENIPRAEVLTELALRMPGVEQDTALREALAAIRTIEDDSPHIRADLLIQLASLLPVPDRAKVLNEALEATLLVKETRPLERTLSLSGGGYEDFKEIRKPPLGKLAEWGFGVGSQSIEFDTIFFARVWTSLVRSKYKTYTRSDLLSRLARLLPIEPLKKALEETRSMKNSQEQARAMIALAQYLPEGEARVIFQRAFHLVDSFESHADCAEFLTDLAPKMPPEQQSAVWARALQAAQLIEKTPIRMMALVRLATNLPSDLQEKAREYIQESVHEWVRALEENWVIAVAPMWAQMPRDISYQLWTPTVKALAGLGRSRSLSDLGRSRFLSALEALIPVTMALGGQEVADAIADAILYVLEWWP
jgi:hypothetical protein